MNICLYATCRRSNTTAAIPRISACPVFLPEPSAGIITDHHSDSVWVISEIYTKTSISVCRFEREIKISGFIKVKLLGVDKHCRFWSRIVSVINAGSQMQPSIFHFAYRIKSHEIVLCPFVPDTIFKNSFCCASFLPCGLCMSNNRIQAGRYHGANHRCCHCEAKHPHYKFFPHLFPPLTWSP